MRKRFVWVLGLLALAAIIVGGTATGQRAPTPNDPPPAAVLDMPRPSVVPSAAGQSLAPGTEVAPGLVLPDPNASPKNISVVNRGGKYFEVEVPVTKKPTKVIGPDGKERTVMAWVEGDLRTARVIREVPGPNG